MVVKALSIEENNIKRLTFLLVMTLLSKCPASTSFWLSLHSMQREGEGGREGRRERGKEGVWECGRELGKKVGREGEREGGREGIISYHK